MIPFQLALMLHRHCKGNVVIELAGKGEEQNLKLQVRNAFLYRKLFQENALKLTKIPKDSSVNYKLLKAAKLFDSIHNSRILATEL